MDLPQQSKRSGKSSLMPTIKDVVKQQKEKNAPPTDRELALQKENRELKARLERFRETSGFQQLLTDKIMKAVDAVEPLPLVPYKAGKSAESEMAAVIQLSDW